MCVCVYQLCLLNCNKLIVIKHRLYILECVIGLFMLQFSQDSRKLSFLPLLSLSLSLSFLILYQRDFTSGAVNDCDKDGSTNTKG